MRREWQDPRDGVRWTIEALPFDAGPGLDGSQATGWTLIFISHLEHRVLPVGYPVGAALETITETALALLLDRAGPTVL